MCLHVQVNAYLRYCGRSDVPKYYASVLDSQHDHSNDPRHRRTQRRHPTASLQQYQHRVRPVQTKGATQERKERAQRCVALTPSPVLSAPPQLLNLTTALPSRHAVTLKHPPPPTPTQTLITPSKNPPSHPVQHTLPPPARPSQASPANHPWRKPVRATAAGAADSSFGSRSTRKTMGERRPWRMRERRGAGRPRRKGRRAEGGRGGSGIGLSPLEWAREEKGVSEERRLFRGESRGWRGRNGRALERRNGIRCENGGRAGCAALSPD